MMGKIFSKKRCAFSFTIFALLLTFAFITVSAYDSDTVLGDYSDFTYVWEYTEPTESDADELLMYLEEDCEEAITDEWVQENTDYENLDEYKDVIMGFLEEQAYQESLSDIIQQLIDQLLDCSDASVTNEELENAVNERIALLGEIAEDYGVSYEELVEAYYDSTVEEYEEGIKEELRKELEETKVLEAFAEQEDIDISDDAFYEYLDEEAEMYGYESGDELYQEYEEMGYGEEVKSLFREFKCGERLIELAKEEEAK